MPEEVGDESILEGFCSVPENVPRSIQSVEDQALRYVSGYLIKKVGALPCTCKDLFVQSNPSTENLKESEVFLRAKEYKSSKLSLKYVTSTFLDKMRYAMDIIKFIFNRDLHKNNLIPHTLKILQDRIRLTDCFHDMKIKTNIFNYLIKIQIFNVTKQINNIIRGLDVRHIPKKAPKYFLSAKNISNVTRLRRRNK